MSSKVPMVISIWVKKKTINSMVFIFLLVLSSWSVFCFHYDLLRLCLRVFICALVCAVRCVCACICPFTSVPVSFAVADFVVVQYWCSMDVMNYCFRYCCFHLIFSLGQFELISMIPVQILIELHIHRVLFVILSQWIFQSVQLSHEQGHQLCSLALVSFIAFQFNCFLENYCAVSNFRQSKYDFLVTNWCSQLVSVAFLFVPNKVRKICSECVWPRNYSYSHGQW